MGNYAPLWQHFEAGKHAPKKDAVCGVTGLLEGGIKDLGLG